MTWRSMLFLLALAFATGLANGQSIYETKHNLTRSGPGDIKARPEIREGICVFCHTPHRPRRAASNQPFSWNREDSTATYTTYESSTMYAEVGQPTGASKLCLSCHDGTIALGSILSQRNVIPFEGDWEASEANLGTHLADDHPVSFVYDAALAAADGQLNDPAMLPDYIRRDESEQVQCTTCHDPHDNSNGMFLVAPDPTRTLCVACHRPTGWEDSSHANSDAVWNGEGVSPWTHETAPGSTVADNVCQNCHLPHNAEGERGLLSYRVEEANCLKCHSGTVAKTDILAEISKRYGHLAQNYLGAHDAGEQQDTYDRLRHVECVDCHNPHQSNQDAAEAPLISGAMRGARGIDISGQPVNEAAFGYEVCFRCHSENAASTDAEIARQLPQLDTRLEFLQENPSSHPVTAQRFNNLVPSLLPDITPDGLMRCTDCHGNDQNTADSGLGPDGPHGSIYQFLLVRNYEVIDGTTESYNAYALCYGCHDRNSILGDQSFAEHDSHVRGQNTPCSVCHDPHGISETQGDSRNHQYLINFDINVVSPNSLGDLYWEEGSQGPGSSRCSLACHGVDHNNTEDKPIGFDPTNGLSGSPNSWPFSGAFPD